MNLKRTHNALSVLETWYSAGTTQFVIHLNDKNVNHFYRQKLKFKTMGLIQHDRYLLEDNRFVSYNKQNQ